MIAREIREIVWEFGYDVSNAQIRSELGMTRKLNGREYGYIRAARDEALAKKVENLRVDIALARAAYIPPRIGRLHR